MAVSKFFGRLQACGDEIREIWNRINGAGDRRTVEALATVPGIEAAISATTISEFFHSICWPIWWPWESASASRPSQAFVSKRRQSHRKQPILNGCSLTMSAVQWDNARKANNRGCKLEHFLTVLIGEGIGL